MHRLIRIAGAVFTLLVGLGAAQLEAQASHEVRLEVDTDKGEYTFTPATVTARAGDVVVFKLVNGAPHSIVFEAKGLSPRAREALNAAMPHRSADLSSPLLTENGAEYRITVPALPAGAYPFFCLPHRAYDMRGELRVK
ncbi:MAG: plastocyanin/azurin family copper-binding protein [Gemmatimonadales bacterium]